MKPYIGSNLKVSTINSDNCRNHSRKISRIRQLYYNRRLDDEIIRYMKVETNAKMLSQLSVNDFIQLYNKYPKKMFHCSYFQVTYNRTKHEYGINIGLMRKPLAHSGLSIILHSLFMMHAYNWNNNFIDYPKSNLTVEYTKHCGRSLLCLNAMTDIWANKWIAGVVDPNSIRKIFLKYHLKMFKTIRM